jgi:hypothetical protein
MRCMSVERRKHAILKMWKLERFTFESQHLPAPSLAKGNICPIGRKMLGSICCMTKRKIPFGGIKVGTIDGRLFEQKTSFHRHGG